MLTRTKRYMAATALLLAAAVSAQGAVPAVLQQVPDDSAVVIVVNDLKGLSTKISNAATRMNVPIPPDLLGMVTQKVGLTKGLDQNGSLAFMLELPKEGDEAAAEAIEPPFVLLVPATDPKAMLAEMKVGDADKDGISSVILPSGGEESGFVITTGKFVAFAQNRSALTRLIGHKGSLAKALSPELTKTFEVNDVVVYANVPQFADKAIKQMDDAKQGIVMMMMMGAGGDEKTGDTLKTIMDMYFGGIKQVLTDTTAGAVTLRLNDGGTTLGFAGHFKPESTLGKLVAAQKPLGSVNLDGLPAGAILGAGTITWDSASASDIFGRILNTIYASPMIAKQANAEEIKKGGELQKQMIALQSGGRFALYEPTDTSKGWLKLAQVQEVSDPKKYEDLFAQVAKAGFGGANAMSPDMKVEVTAKPNALTVKGVDLNKYIIKMVFADNPDKAEQIKMQQKMIDTIYGPDGIVIYSGIIGEKQVVTVLGGDDKFATEAVTAAVAKSTALSLAPEIVAASKETVGNPSMVAYLPVDEWIKLARRQFMGGAGSRPAGEGLAIGAPPTPLTVSIGFTPTSATMELHVPMSTMISISQTIKDIEGAQMQQMQPMPAQPPMGQ